jgi:glycosyltransferase involved in cell wall biosynthesis
LKDIIYITESNGYSGAERYLIDLVSCVNKMYTKVHVAFHFKEQNVKLRDQLKAKGVDVVDIKRYNRNHLLNLLNAFKFIFPRKEPLFHFTLPYFNSCRWLLLAASLLRRKYIITELLVPPSPFKKGWKFLKGNLLWNPLKKFSYIRAEKVIAICEATKNLLIKEYGMPSEKIIVIYTGIDATPVDNSDYKKNFLRHQFNISKERLVLTSIGRLHEQKGHVYLLCALEQLASEFPDVLLLLVGDGPLRNTIEAEIISRNLMSKVNLMGYREDIRDILSITDIFILPSLYEGFPYIILESMAAGNSLIVTDVGGNSESVINGITGIVVPPKNVDYLYKAIVSLVKNPSKRKEMGEKGRQEVLIFSKEVMLQKTISLYANM